MENIFTQQSVKRRKDDFNEEIKQKARLQFCIGRGDQRV